MPKLIKETNLKSAIESVLVENNKLTVSARNRKEADKLMGIYIFAMRSISHSHREIDFKIDHLLRMDISSIYPKPYKMIVMSGKLDFPLELLKLDLSSNVFDELSKAVAPEILQKIEESNEDDSKESKDNTSTNYRKI